MSCLHRLCFKNEWTNTPFTSISINAYQWSVMTFLNYRGIFLFITLFIPWIFGQVLCCSNWTKFVIGIVHSTARIVPLYHTVWINMNGLSQCCHPHAGRSGHWGKKNDYNTLFVTRERIVGYVWINWINPGFQTDFQVLCQQLSPWMVSCNYTDPRLWYIHGATVLEV